MITIPTIAELKTQIKADLEAEFGENIPVFGKVMLNVLIIIIAGALKSFYLFIASLQKNIFVDTADPEASGGTLERFGRVKLGRNPFAAIAGQYKIQVTGTTGAIIPTGTIFKSDDDSLNPGILYVLDNEFELTAPTDEITVRALTAGDAGKLEVADTLTATAPIADVDKAAEVIEEAVEPLEAETTEDYRGKTIQAFQTEPQGGAGSDYRLWAADAQGVKQVYAYAKSGVTAEVNLYVEATEADSTDGKGTPSAGLLSDVEDVVEMDPDTTKPLEDRGRRPLGVFQIHFLPVTPLNIIIEITDFQNLTTAIQDAVEASLTSMINKIRPFVATADVIEDKNDILDINKVIGAILAAAPGAIFSSVTMGINGVPTTTFTFDDGNIPFVESIDFV